MRKKKIHPPTPFHILTDPTTPPHSRVRIAMRFHEAYQMREQPLPKILLFHKLHDFIRFHMISSDYEFPSLHMMSFGEINDFI